MKVAQVEHFALLAAVAALVVCGAGVGWRRMRTR